MRKRYDIAQNVVKQAFFYAGMLVIGLLNALTAKKEFG